MPAPILTSSSSLVLRSLMLSVVLAAAATQCSAQPGSPSPQAVLLRQGIRIDSAESAAVLRGEVTVRILPTPDSRDVAMLGVVRVATARDTYLRRVQNFRSWLRTPTRTRLGVFGEPAALADAEQVVVTRQDANDLRNCKPGDCTTKLSAAQMQRVRDEIDWSATDVQARITMLARQRLVQFVQEYRERGNSAMPTYDDKASVRASDAFAAVLAQSGYLNRMAPEIVSYLKTYPRGRPGGVSDVHYWSEDAVPRLRPILSVTHAVVFTPPEVSGASIVASKQIYANHYFEAALDVLSVIDDPSDNQPPGVYLVMERRFRFDNLPRGLLNIRGRATSGLRDQLRDALTRERNQFARRVTSER